MHRFTDQMGNRMTLPEFPPQRIVSLVPSQTELLFDLGLGERVVGITKFCIHPDEWFQTKPRVGGTKKVNIAKVRALQPDLIIGNKEENAKHDIEMLQEEFPVWMSDITGLETALDMIQKVGVVTGVETRALQIAEATQSAFETLHLHPTPKTAAYFIWNNPMMVAGRATFIDEMMQRCGLRNVFREVADAGSSTHRYPEINVQQLADANPDLILLSSEPFPFGEKHIAYFQEVCKNATCFLVDGTYFSWYGSRLKNSPRYFSTLFGP